MKLLSFGEVLFDVYEDGRFLGGAPLNFAAHCALLGCDSYILTAVGNDTMGTEACEAIDRLGVGTGYIQKLSDKETGKCTVTLDANAVPSYKFAMDVAYDYIECPDFADGESFDVFAFGTLSFRQDYNIGTVSQILEKNICSEVYADLNIRAPFYSQKSILFCLENATILKISDEELPVVTEAAFGRSMGIEEAVQELVARFKQLKLIIITCGEKGSCVYDCRKAKMHSANAEPADVVSTVGAGDSFGAAFLASYFAGTDLTGCLKTASKVSAFVVSNKDAIPDGMSEFVKNNLL